MHTKTFATIVRLAACAGVTGVLALGLQTTHTSTATSATTSAVVLADAPSSNPWEG